MVRKRLSTILADFNLEEVKDLCFNLNVNYDDLSGVGRGNKRELILLLEKQKRLEDLLLELKEFRPSLSDEIDKLILHVQSRNNQDLNPLLGSEESSKGLLL